MPSVERIEADERLAHLVDQAEHGQEVIITKNGRDTARIIPIDPFDRKKVRQAIARLRQLRVGTRLDGLSIKELITEGRR